MLWVFHWGRNSFIPPMKHLIYKMKSFFYELKPHFASYFVSLQCNRKSWQTRGWASQLSLFLVSIVAEDAEQIEEEVDEVEIQRQGSEEGKLLSALAHVILSLEHLFNLLAIPGSQTDEDSHTDIAQDVIETRALQEHVYHGSDNQSDQSHEEYLAH